MVGVLRFLLLVCLLASPATAQTRDVNPDDLTLTVTLEPLPDPLLRQEMVLLTIHGTYRRHITRERLEQPVLDGFNWMQLGQDEWFDSMRDGLPVRNMRRRMAVFPDGTGRLEIGPFRHHVTLLDEDNKWFEYTVQSDPLTVDVTPAPPHHGWWFPVRGLEISDSWSNAPDQLATGEGVLRIIRLSALGASPDMIPPMPELTSPSALIFSHPEKRLVELTPYGPRSVAFWRWTVTPTNGNSAVLEPIRFTYFDTATRQMREAVISAQRIAFGDVTGSTRPTEPQVIRQTVLRPGLLGLGAALGLVAGLLAMLAGRRFSWRPLSDAARRKHLLWQLGVAARRGDMAQLRRTAHALDAQSAPSAGRHALLVRLDNAVFAASPQPWAPDRFYRDFRRTL